MIRYVICDTSTQRDAGTFVKKILGENEIEEVLGRLDRLTLDEIRATGAQTLKIVHGLVQHRRVVMDGENIVVACPSFTAEFSSI